MPQAKSAMKESAIVFMSCELIADAPSRLCGYKAAIGTGLGVWSRFARHAIFRWGCIGLATSGRAAARVPPVLIRSSRSQSLRVRAILAGVRSLDTMDTHEGRSPLPSPQSQIEVYTRGRWSVSTHERGGPDHTRRFIGMRVPRRGSACFELLRMGAGRGGLVPTLRDAARFAPCRQWRA